jgi:SPX domain protein involved in polyphosphate accumulation
VLQGRYELKFVVDAAQRSGILAAAADVLQRDPFCGEATYRVTSQYVDTAALRWYWEKVDGVDPRRKVRLRAYGDATDAEALAAATAFLEIKHRRKDQIFKERVRLQAGAANALLADTALLRDLSAWVVDDAAPGTRGRIERDASQWELVAINVITYRREAFLSQIDTRLRLTFDHDVQALPSDGFLRAPAEEGQPLLAPGQTVMELKFDQRLPRWAREALIAHRVRPQRFSKYARGVEALGQTR